MRGNHSAELEASRIEKRLELESSSDIATRTLEGGEHDQVQRNCVPEAELFLPRLCSCVTPHNAASPVGRAGTLTMNDMVSPIRRIDTSVRSWLARV